MRERVERFLHYLEDERGLAENSRTAYATDLLQWCDYLEREAIEEDAVLGEDIYNFLSSLETLDAKNRPEKKSIERRSQARKLSALRTFYRFLELRQIVQKNPTRLLRAARFKRLLPRPLRVGEMEDLLDFSEEETFAALRDNALWETLYASGMRISEALSLEASPFSQEKIPDEICITGKGKKDRIVFLGRAAREAIAEYLPVRADTLYRLRKTCAALFINFKGTPLTRRGALYLLRKRTHAVGLDARITPHSFRHSFATDLLNGGANIRHVQEMLGHASVSTTQNYTHVAKEKLFEVYRKSHPHGKQDAR